MALSYVTVGAFWKRLGIYENVLDFQPGSTPEKETVASSPVTAGDYYLDLLGVDEDNLNLYAGSTQLTITTHYTFDSDTSKVTITSAGATALSGEDLTADYGYCSLGRHLNYNETLDILEAAEASIHNKTHTVFSNVATPTYKAIVDEKHNGKGGNGALYSTALFPIVKLHTTVNGAYTTGGAEITLADATGFPSSGTIYIGGNKVTYTALSTNTLTIPTSTPSIPDGAVVRGEVIEVSTDSSGAGINYTVLDPDTDYSIDYDTGVFQLQDEFYYLNDGIGVPQRGVMDRVNVSYQQAYHDEGADPEIPFDLPQIIFSLAGRVVRSNTVLKSHINQRDNFNPQSTTETKELIDDFVSEYTFKRTRQS